MKLQNEASANILQEWFNKTSVIVAGFIQAGKPGLQTMISLAVYKNYSNGLTRN